MGTEIECALQSNSRLGGEESLNLKLVANPVTLAREKPFGWFQNRPGRSQIGHTTAPVDRVRCVSRSRSTRSHRSLLSWRGLV